MVRSKENYFALFVFTLSIVSFLIWGHDYVQNNFGIFILATVFALFMAFNVGGNDVANSFGTSVGAKTLSIKQALVVAAIFEISGAIIAGGEVTNTIRKGIVNLDHTVIDPMLFVFVMMSALASAGTWLLFSSKKGLPVSTTHAIVGGITGGTLALGFVLDAPNVEPMSLISWDKVLTIAMSWVISPLLGGILSYAIYWYLKHFILDVNQEKEYDYQRAKTKIPLLQKQLLDDTLSRSKRSTLEVQLDECKILTSKANIFSALRQHIPIVAGFAITIIASMLLFKGLKKLNFDFGPADIIFMLVSFATFAYISMYTIIKLMRKDSPKKATIHIFSILQIFTASAFAFSHGANDIANAIGPFAAILDVLASGEINSSAPVPFVVMLTFGIALIVGLWFIGKEVIATVGSRLTEIFPVTGFAAELAASAVILSATKLGIPVSSTHILIGAVLGIGLLNHNANWNLMKPIAVAWVVTLPVSALMSAVVFVVLKSGLGY